MPILSWKEIISHSTHLLCIQVSQVIIQYGNNNKYNILRPVFDSYKNSNFSQVVVLNNVHVGDMNTKYDEVGDMYTKCDEVGDMYTVVTEGMYCTDTCSMGYNYKGHIRDDTKIA